MTHVRAIRRIDGTWFTVLGDEPGERSNGPSLELALGSLLRQYPTLFDLQEVRGDQAQGVRAALDPDQFGMVLSVLEN